MKVSKQNKWLLLTGVFLLLVILYFLPVTVTTTASVNVHLPYQKTLEQLTSFSNWTRWWPDSAALRIQGDTVFESGKPAYILESRKMLSLVLTNSGKTEYNVLTVVPASYDSVSTVQWKRLSYLRQAVNDRVASLFGGHRRSPHDLLQSLQTRLEDPVSNYGFRVSVVPVEDTFVLVKSTMTTRAELTAAIQRTYSQLHRYLDSLHYAGKAERMLYVDSSHTDSVEVIAGYSLDRSVAVTSPFRLMTMPKAHIVVGEYTGDYRNIGSIHTAIEAFMADHRISPVAIAYEKMLSDPRTAQDSLRVRVRVFYPSYIP